MAKHIIRIPDRLRGRELRTIEWDDEAGTVSGDHSEIDDIRRVFAASKPVTVGQGAVWDLRDPAHDPAEFLVLIEQAFWPALDPPLRETLPAVFDGVALPAPEFDGETHQEPPARAA